jgi:hypothetical protein
MIYKNWMVFHIYVSMIEHWGFLKWGYPLVNSHVTMEKTTMLSMGKSTISMGHFQ